MPTYTPQEGLRRNNTAAILNLILRKSPISRSQLSQETGLSAQTVSIIVRNLVERGLVAETGVNSSGNVGRQPVNLDIRADGAYAIGFNLERDRLTKVLVNLKGDLIHSDYDTLDSHESPRHTLSRLTEYVDWIRNSKEYSYIEGKVCGVGIGSPGPIDYSRGVVMSPPNFPNWSEIPVREILKHQLDFPVLLDNSSTVAAIGELWRGRWLEDSFLYCHWGIGIGGGLILNGNPYRGLTGNTIEIGHTVVVHDGAICQCGQHGCLELYSAIPAILRDAARYGQYGNLDALIDQVDATPGLNRVLVRAAEFLGQAIVSALNVLDVNLVIMGGHHFHEVESYFMPILIEIVDATSFRRAVSKVEVVSSSLEEEAGAIGAALLVFQELLLRNGNDSVDD